MFTPRSRPEYKADFQDFGHKLNRFPMEKHTIVNIERRGEKSLDIYISNFMEFN